MGTPPPPLPTPPPPGVIMSLFMLLKFRLWPDSIINTSVKTLCYYSINWKHLFSILLTWKRAQSATIGSPHRLYELQSQWKDRFDAIDCRSVVQNEMQGDKSFVSIRGRKPLNLCGVSPVRSKSISVEMDFILFLTQSVCLCLLLCVWSL